VSRLAGAALVLAALLLWEPAGAGAYSRPAEYGVHSVHDVTIRMSDGVELAADVHYPADPATGAPAPGRFPVILSQTPYGKRSFVTTGSFGEFGGDGYFPYLVRRGYINAIVEVRGTGSSGGEFGLFAARDTRDGVELVRWAAGLERSSGRVGGAGYSYPGLNQIHTAAAVGRRSPLKAIVPSAAGFDLYRDLAFGGGIPNVLFASVWSALRASMVLAAPDNPGEDPLRQLIDRVDRARGLAALDAGLYSEIELGGERAYDGAFWRARAPARRLRRVVRNRVPALLISGWFDVYQRGVLLNYAALQNASARRRDVFGPMRRGQKLTPRYQIVQGPWVHNAVGMGEWIQEVHLEWFDRWLLGRRTPLTRTRRPLHAFELGSGRWIDAGVYPLPRTRVRTLWLGGGGSGTAPLSLNDGRLGESRPAQGSDPLPWADAASPCSRLTDQWSLGFLGAVSAGAGMPLDPCAGDDRSTQAGALTYTSDPFGSARTIAGPASVRVVLSSSSPDSELVATLEDVAPDGTSYPLTSGALLGSFRELDRGGSWRHRGRLILPQHPYTRASRRQLVPGRAEPQLIELPPIFARIDRGHRLRLTLATSAPHLHPTLAQLPGLEGGVYQVRRGPGGSFVNVPMAAPGRLVTSRRRFGECNSQC
jgi:putative CocE/NonD family hydrolase